MKKLKIGIQGVAGSFHEEVAKKYFGETIETVECLSFEDLCESMANGEMDNCVMAIENSIAGTLLPNYSLLQKYHLKIIGEDYLRIQMNLMVLPGVNLTEIKYVHSHPIAIRQCSEYLRRLENIEIAEKEDTALAAKKIKELQLKDTAAIANLQAAELYGLQILEKGIETNKQNYTRFLVLSKQIQPNNKNNKASISMQLGHTTGSLANALNIFKDNDVNLTKIQSVPILGKPYEYNFHIDLEWTDKNNYETAINQLLQHASSLSILGEYKKGDYVN